MPERKNITQEQLAEKLGVTNKSISRWENGKNMPDYSVLEELCQVLDMDVNEFLSGERIKKDEIQVHTADNLDSILKEYYKMKKQRNTFKTLGISLLCILMLLGMIGIIRTVSLMFREQYNTKGISHYLVIAMDKNQPKEYIGELESHRIFVEGLNVDATNFRTVCAGNVSIKEAIEKGMVSIEDWRKYAWEIIEDGDAEILRYENYEIVIAYDDCIIRPISK